MIIKVVERQAGEYSSYERLGRYILNTKQNESVLFTRTAEYVIDMKGVGEKVAWYRISNCESELPAAVIAEIMATQEMNTRTQSDKTYHLVVSVPHWEQLTREQAEDIEDAICTGLGFEGHQRVSAVHQNTDHFHLHIAISKIHPKTFNCYEPYYPYYKLDGLAKELEIKHGLHQDNRIGHGKSFAKMGGLEAHQQEESFQRWLHENLGDQIKEVLEKGQGWQDLHDLMTAHGAVIKPRGAGLAISTLDGSIGIKASSLDRKLAFASLTKRFGEYQEPRGQEQHQKKQYQHGKSRIPGANSLFAEYQKNRQGNYESRTKALDSLRAEHAEQRNRLKERHRERRVSVKANTEMNAKTKKLLYQELSQQMKADFERQKKQEQDQKSAVREKYPAQTWDEYLISRAKNGHTEALSILRKRRNYRRLINQALLTIDNIDEARDIIKTHFKPTVLRNGKVIYRAKDGGVVSDEATAISVPEVTEAAALLALSLADERFKGKAIVVEGTDEFKIQVAKLSALEGLSIRFADSVLEADRQRYVRARVLGQEAQKQKDKGKHQEKTSGQERDYQGR